jgi:hypothetical protein
MNMKRLIMIILTLAAVNAYGQNHFVGIKGCINRTNVTRINLFDNYYKTGFSGGLTYEYLFLKHFSVGAEIIYEQRGFLDDIVFTNETGIPTGERYRSKMSYNYISLPIKAGYSLGTKVFGFAKIGAVPSLLVNAQAVLPKVTSGKVIGEIVADMTNYVPKFDFAGLVEIGGGYKFNDRNSIFSSFTYQHSLTSLYDNSNVRLNGMTLTLGFKRALSN